MINENECEEIFEFLSYMNKEEVMKIPEEILTFIKNNRNVNFKTKIDKKDLFNFDNMSENSLSFLIYIDKLYWEKNNGSSIYQLQNTNNFEENMLQVKNINLFQRIFKYLKKYLKNMNK